MVMLTSPIASKLRVTAAGVTSTAHQLQVHAAEVYRYPVVVFVAVAPAL